MKRASDPCISTPVVGNLFFEGSNVRLTVTHDAKTAPELIVTASGSGKVVRRALSRKRTQDLSLGKLPVDFYTATVSAGSSELVKRTFGVIPPRRLAGDPEASPYGTWAKIGFQFQRLDCCFDSVMTGKPGAAQWNDNRRFADGTGAWFPGHLGYKNYMEVFDAIHAVGMEPMPIMEMKSGNWEIGKRGTMRLVPVFEHLDEYDTFVYEAVKLGRLNCVEFWNEPEFYWNWGEAPTPDIKDWHGRFVKAMPMEEYIRTLKVCHNAAKRANPYCRIILGGTLGQGQFTENVYRFGGKPYFDIVGVHYLNGGSPDGFGWQVRYLREIMARYGDNKPIFDTEFGYGDGTKYMTLAAMFDTVPSGPFNPLMDANGPVSSAVSIAVITSLLEGATFAGSLDLGRDNAGILFRKQNGMMFAVFWAAQKLRAVLETDAQTVTLRNMYGPTQRLRTADKQFKIELNSVPLIIEGFRDIRLVEGPYDSAEYRAISDISPIRMSRATNAIPTDFPRVKSGQIKVDGNLADWKGIPAICAPNQAQKVEALPDPENYKFDKYRCLMGEARFAYDKKNLYVAARVVKDRKAQVNPDVAYVFFTLRGFDYGVQWEPWIKGQSLIVLISRPGGPNVVRLQPCDISISERELAESRIVTKSTPREIVFEAAIPGGAFLPLKPIAGKIAEARVLFGGDDGNDYYWWYRVLSTHWFIRPPAAQVELKFES